MLPKPAPRSLRGSAVALALFGLLALAQPSASAGQTGLSFAAGVQWTDAADPAAPWIPRQVAFAGDAEWVLAARAFQTPGLALLGAQEELDGPLLALGAAAPSALSPLSIASSGEALYRAERVDSEGQQRLRVERLAAAVGEFWVHWSALLPSAGQGAARLLAAPSGPLLAERTADGARVRVTALDAHDGGVRWSTELEGGTLRAFDLDAAGARALVLAGTRVWVLEVGGGGVLLARTHQPEPRTATLAGDGTRLALGHAGRAESWSLDPTVGAPEQSIEHHPSRVAVALDLSHDARCLAVGWWDGSDGRSVELDLWELDPRAPARLDQRLALPGGVGSPQDFVAAVRLVGERAAFGLWGDGAIGAGSAQAPWKPELVVLERGRSAPLLALELAGSVLDLDLDGRGERVAVARKLGHATLFASQGAIDLVDTGERDLALDRTPTGSTTLAVEVALPALAAWVLIGRASPPLALPGLDGLLAIDPAGPLLLWPAVPVGADRWRAELPVPGAAAGLEFALQAVVIDGQGAPVASATWTHSRVL